MSLLSRTTKVVGATRVIPIKAKAGRGVRAILPKVAEDVHDSRVFKIISSSYEPSKNFLLNYGKGVIEARYVRKDTRDTHTLLTSNGTKDNVLDIDKGKEKNYVACYVSSHNGCKMNCKMCHLSYNNDTTMKHVDIPTYLTQIRTVLDHYRHVTDPKNFSDPSQVEPLAQRCNINFMSKGDAMANKYLTFHYPELYLGMKSLCAEYDLHMKPNISTIMPVVLGDRKLSDIFGHYPAYMYYSLYSVNPRFRSIWLPNAMDYRKALDKLKEYQESQTDQTPITFHWALIKGQNDQIEDAKELANVLRSYQFKGKLNIVRFNPHPSVSDEEASIDRIQEVFEIVADVFKSPLSYIVPRLDVKTKTPCGMFVPLDELPILGV